MIYGERIRQARELCGLTQSALAREIGVNQSAIAHVESGRNSPSRDVLEAIAKKTEVAPSFFERPPIGSVPIGSLAFRARAALRASERGQAYQYAKLFVEYVQAMDDQLELPPLQLPRGRHDPITAARLTRLALSLSSEDPVGNLTSAMEKNGLFIFALPVVLPRLDAFSSWADVDTARPFVVISSGKPGDRLRFSVAHELGHIVLHREMQDRSSIMETEANRFAAEFLLPEAPMRRVLSPSFNLVSAARLKVRWGVSMQMLIRRARELEIITDRRYRYLFEQMGSRGWRTKEPSNLEIPVEKPRAFRKMVEVLYGEHPVEKFAVAMHIGYRRASAILREFSGPLPPPKSVSALTETEEYIYPGGHESSS